MNINYIVFAILSHYQNISNIIYMYTKFIYILNVILIVLTGNQYKSYFFCNFIILSKYIKYIYVV